MSRFNYIRYDGQSLAIQQHAKIQASFLEDTINELAPSRATNLALDHLEECYMWIGKAIRDDQVNRNVNLVLQEERNNL